MKYAYTGKAARESLAEAGIELDPSAPIVLVERGAPIPENKIAVVFDESLIGELCRFLQSHSKSETPLSSDFIACRDEERIILVKAADIEFFSVDGDAVFCNIRSGRTLEVKKKLYELEQILFDRGFFRVSKSAIVNIVEINDISPWFGGRLLLRLKNGRDEIEVSRKYVTDFKEYLGV